jgi:DNA (cytosine-5)-methyltransferase 1
MRRIVSEIRPPFVFVENSPLLTSRGLDRILGDFAEMGYDARWGVVSGADAGLDHIRKRIWIVAYTGSKPGAYSNILKAHGRNFAGRGRFKKEWGKDRQFTEMRTKALRRLGMEWRKGNNPPASRGIVNGLAHQLDRLKAIGNGQISIVAALAWTILSAEMTDSNDF